MNQSERGGQLSVYYHTHWDREWYMPFRAYQVRLAEVVDEILDRLEQGVLPCFMLDGQTVVLEDYLELRPENRARLKRLVESGQISIGPWYVMPDEFLVGGESLIRNLVRGIRESQAWGCSLFTGYLPDTFGHSADMPTIFKHCGIDSAVVWRGVNPAKSLFRWESPNHASVLALHLNDGYFQMMLHDWAATEPQQLDALDALVKKLERVSVPGERALLPIGGDHLAPVTEHGHALLKGRFPNLDETTPEKYLARVNVNGKLAHIAGELTDNSGSFLLPGVYSSRLYLKQANRRLEHLLVHKLEPLLAMAQAWLPQGRFRHPAHELDLAWKTLILNHPHDSICGCSVDEVHRENEVRFDQVEQLGEAMLHRAEYALTQALAGSNEWLVFNTTAQPYTGVVSVLEDLPDEQAESHVQASAQTVLQDEYLHDAHRLPLSHLTKLRKVGHLWVEGVPPFGVKRIPKHSAGQAGSVTPPPVIVDRNRLENELLHVRVEGDGTLTVSDKRTGQKNPGLMEFRLQPDQGDSYNSAPVPGQPGVKLEFRGCQHYEGSGGLRGQIVLNYSHTEEKGGYAFSYGFTTTLSLSAGSDLLEFETVFVNQCMPQHKLQVGFPTGKPIESVAAESHLGIVARAYDPAYRPQDHMPVEKMKELKSNTGPIQRFISANGQSWITEGLTEYEVYQKTLLITLLRSFQALSKADTGVRGAQAGPPLATPEGNCLNRQMVCRYAWTPTPSEPERLYHQAAAWYGQQAMSPTYKAVWALSGAGQKDQNPDVDSQALSLLSWEQPGLVASACYWSDGKGLVLRLLNTKPESLSARMTIGFSYRVIHEADFLESVQSTLTEPVVTVGPLDVKTLLFEV